MTYCAFCHLNYCEDVAEDRRDHRKRCKLWGTAVSTLNYHPSAYREREGLKTDGWELVHREGATLEQQVQGALMVIRAHFDRSLESAIDGGFWRKHPKFEGYVAVTTISHFPEAVVKELTRRYGRKEGVIPHGRTYWEPQPAAAPSRTSRPSRVAA